MCVMGKRVRYRKGKRLNCHYSPRTAIFRIMHFQHCFIAVISAVIHNPMPAALCKPIVGPSFTATALGGSFIYFYKSLVDFVLAKGPSLTGRASLITRFVFDIVILYKTAICCYFLIVKLSRVRQHSFVECFKAREYTRFTTHPSHTHRRVPKFLNFTC